MVSLMMNMFAVLLAFTVTIASAKESTSAESRDLTFCFNHYVCPANSYRIPYRLCYDNFDDCACNHGYYKSTWEAKCIPYQPVPTPTKAPVCYNHYVCPANSYRLPNRACYDSFDDCGCNHGYYKSPTEEKCIPIATPAPIKPPTNAPVKPPTSAPVKPPTGAPRTMSPTRAPRTMSPTRAPRTKSPTRAPRTVSPTRAPRTMSPTRAPRTMSPTRAPVKPPTGAPVKPPTRAPVKPPTRAPVKPPTRAPVKPPTRAPVKPPTRAPVKPPTRAPVKPPTRAPVKPPTRAPVKPPTRAPVKPPTRAPVKPPTRAPVKPPTRAPVKPPTRAPVKPPTRAPVKPPTRAPVKPPTRAPVKPPTYAPVKAPTYGCVLPPKTSDYSIISFHDATIAGHSMYKGVAIGGTFYDGSPSEYGTVDRTMSYIYKLDSNTKFHFNGGLTLGQTISQSIIDQFTYLATHAVSGTYANNYKVVVLTRGGTYNLYDFVYDGQGEDNGKTLVIFNTYEDITITQSVTGRQFGPTIIAPFSKVIVLGDAGYVDGTVVGKSVHTSGPNQSALQFHGDCYTGPITCK